MPAVKKKKKETALDYGAEVRKLKEQGPRRLYLLWGEEDYLRDDYMKTLREICAQDDPDGFQSRIFKDAQPDPVELRFAIDTLPFFSERSLIEIREMDYLKPGDPDGLMHVLEDIPDYCTVAFVLDHGEEPNGKSKIIKYLREHGSEIHFTVQDQNMLIRWISRRFAYYGKSLEIDAAQRLIWLSGDQMKRLIPEIEKIAAYARGEKVTVSDVNAVANRIPEADIFELTDAIAERRFNTATGVLADLLEQRDSSVPAILSLLSNQFRRLYLASQVPNSAALMELTGLKYDFMARRLIQSARNFQPQQLQKAIEHCAQADYRLKSESTDEKQLLKETLMRIVLEVSDA